MIISPKERERLVKHEDFAKRFSKATEGMKVDDSILATLAPLHAYLHCVLYNMSFSSLGMDYETYAKLVECDVSKMEWGLLHKACQLILSSPPKDVGDFTAVEYVQIIKPCVACIDHINTLLVAKTDEGIQAIAANELLSGRK